MENTAETYSIIGLLLAFKRPRAHLPFDFRSFQRFLLNSLRLSGSLAASPF